MAIGGIGAYGGLFNNYRVVDIPKVDIEEVKKQDAQVAAAAENVSGSVVADSAPALNTEAQVEDTRSKSADLDNISLSFNKGDDYSYIGSESPIGNLDMEQAISDMRKDKILEDYQYFVGSSENLMQSMNNEDGKVFLKF